MISDRHEEIIIVGDFIISANLNPVVLMIIGYEHIGNDDMKFSIRIRSIVKKYDNFVHPDRSVVVTT